MDEQSYIDRYDLHTIEECLRTIETFRDLYKKLQASTELKHLSPEEKSRNTDLMLSRFLFVIKGKRYEEKKETIKTWMQEDKLKQDKQDYTPVPDGIMCPLCKASMLFNKSKHLEYTFNSSVLRMMFLFKCIACEKQQWVYDDGEIRVSQPDFCPKCSKDVDINATRKGKVITWKRTCKSCEYTKTEIDDLAKRDAEHRKWQEEHKKKEEEDRKLLEKYRKDFCLSDKDGKEYVETLEAMEVANEIYEEEKQKYNDTTYQEVVNLKKFNVLEIEKLLSESLKKETYVKLSLDKPEMGKHITVPFTVLDANSARNQNVSTDTLKKLIKTTLEDTNWRLMSDGIHFRLGYLTGTLKAYEQDDDLRALYEKKATIKAPKSKIDPDKRAKYMHHNLVQLARMNGEFEGIEEARKQRLKKEPDGFFLNDGKGPYSCSICGEHHYGNEIWWNLDGQRCADCWRNIKEGVIPPLKNRYDKDRVYFQDWQIQSDFGVHPSTRRKLQREGLLVGRGLKRKDGTVYYTIYLNSENQKFLKKYPKLKSRMRETIVGTEGKTIEL